MNTVVRSNLMSQSDLSESAARLLSAEGVDPHRVVGHRFGLPKHLSWAGQPPWVWMAIAGLALWLAVVPAEFFGLDLPAAVSAVLSLVLGLLFLASACDALVTATERLAARQSWNHYVAGTVAEIVSTLPELVVICFVVWVSPLTAMVIALVTIYNNALVFSVYSYFLPKDHQGKFLMPAAITEVGTQLLIAGAGLGSVIGTVMLVFSAGGHQKQAFDPIDLVILGAIMFCVFAVYMSRLVTSYASGEESVQQILELDDAEIEERRAGFYGNVERTSVANIGFLLLTGSVMALLGGERVSEFARVTIDDLGLNPIAAAICLAAFAGMSEYMILWRAHRKKLYGIALANAFGGITQVMFLVLPFTLCMIAGYQVFFAPDPAATTIGFTLYNVLLFVLLFPTFYVLIALIEEDHTLGPLDTITMIAIFSVIVLILLGYGGA